MRPEHWLYTIPLRLRSLFRRAQADQELDDELRDHLERKTEEYTARGMTQEEARRRVRLDLGGIEQTIEKCRDARRVNWIQDFVQDFRYGLRMLRKNPSFTVVAVATLAIGIGANAAIFSMVDWLVLRLPPIANPGQVVTLGTEDIRGGHSNGFSYPDYWDIRNQSGAAFSDVAAFLDFQTDGFSADGKSESIWASYVTGNYFQMMGLKPALGSLIQAIQQGSPEDQAVVVLSYSFWQVHFGGDSGVVGKSVLVNGNPVTIIGVAPSGFHGITSLADAQGYLPLGMAAVTGDVPKDLLTDRKSGNLVIIARLRPGVTQASAQPQLNVIAQRLSANPERTEKWKSLNAYALCPISPVGDPSGPSTMQLISGLFLILAGFLLLLACLNVANLLLARAAGRQREMALRAAVGGKRGRLIRQLLTESLLLALLGCGAGIALGLVTSDALASVDLKTGIPFVMDFQFNWRVFAYAFGLAVITAVVAGIAPALRGTQCDLNDLLHESGRTGTVGRQRTRSLLVMAQVGGSLMLLIVAGLFVRSLRNVEHSHLGFEAAHVLNFTVNAHQTGYNDAQAREFLKSLLARERALPGVEAASLAATTPMGYTYLGMQLNIEGYQPPAGEDPPSVPYNAVTSQYFKVMHIPVVSGRGFLDSDDQPAPQTAVINEAMAEEYWHGENPIGRHFTNTADPKHTIEVVGIAGNIRTAPQFSRPIGSYLYLSLAQHYDYRLPVTLQLRTSLPMAVMNHEVVGEIHAVAQAMPVSNIQTMNEALNSVNGFMLFKIGAVLAGALGVLGFVLATVGVYGVVSYGASQRTQEIGIRMALGAQPSQVTRMIFRQGFLIVGGGIVAGMLAAAGIGRLFANLLVGVSPMDTTTYVGAALVLAAVALAACYLPARRTTKVDPMVALRYE